MLVDTSVIARSPTRLLVRVCRARLGQGCPVKPAGWGACKRSCCTASPWLNRCRACPVAGLQVAGMGDAMATYFEARAASEACSKTVLGGTATLTG